MVRIRCILMRMPSCFIVLLTNSVPWSEVTLAGTPYLHIIRSNITRAMVISSLFGIAISSTHRDSAHLTTMMYVLCERVVGSFCPVRSMWIDSKGVEGVPYAWMGVIAFLLRALYLCPCCTSSSGFTWWLRFV